MTIDPERLLAGGPHVSVGILTADLLRLGEELSHLEDAGIELIHIDVMDGRFCPQLTIGAPVVRAIPDRFVKDVHLMVDEPLESIHAYVDAGASIVTFHLESTRHPHHVLQSLADRNVVRGVALNPGTPVAAVEPLLDELDLVLVLAVNPGWPGQTFLPSTEPRLAEARKLMGRRSIVLAVDGGVTRSNVAYVASLNPDLIVAGSAVFDGGNAGNNVRSVLETVASTVSAARA